MNGDMLSAYEVLSRRELGRDGKREIVQVLRGERDARSAIGDGGDLVNLEPHVPGAIEGGDVGRRFGHIDV